MNSITRPRLLAILSLAAAITLSPRVHAQVPGIINYQGRVTVGGTPFTGTGQFQFSLLNNGTTPVWSNGVNTVSLPVEKGLFSVLLGDTTIPNMANSIPPAVFTNTIMMLRVWFNDGVHGLQQLSPDQRLASVGYAMVAAGVPPGAITSDQLAPNLSISGGLSANAFSLPTTSDSSTGVLFIGGMPFLHTYGYRNTFVGYSAGNFTMTGGYNTANGRFALWYNTTGSENAANGYSALMFNTTGYENTADGANALLHNGTGALNTANKSYALTANTEGSGNTADGAFALYKNTTSGGNTALGSYALYNNTMGYDNTADGDAALYGNTTGSENIALGGGAGQNLTTGDYNIDIGNDGVAGDAQTIRIGTDGNHTATYVAGIFGATALGGSAVYIRSDGKLGTVTSSRRFKEGVQDMGDHSEALLSLRPVAFRYKPEIDPDGLAQYGLVAEEVEKVDPDLVVRDAQGAAYSVRYEQIHAMLLNEFLKEHRVVQEQQKQIQALNQQIAALVAKIQAVDDMVARSLAAPTTAANVPSHGGR